MCNSLFLYSKGKPTRENAEHQIWAFLRVCERYTAKKNGGRKMISRFTFLHMIDAITDSVDAWRKKLSKCFSLSESEKEEIIRGNTLINDTITMLETVTGDRYGVIRDYVFDRSENGEYFFVISTPNKTEAVYIDSPQALCEYLNISKVAKNRDDL